MKYLHGRSTTFATAIAAQLGCFFIMLLVAAGLSSAEGPVTVSIEAEDVAGDGVWISPAPARATPATNVVAKVWFDRQLLGSGTSYMERAKEITGLGRRDLRKLAVARLQKTSEESNAAAKEALAALLDDKTISNLATHWVVNGFTCHTTIAGVDKLKAVPGVKKIFLSQLRGRPRPAAKPAEPIKGPVLPDKAPEEAFDPARYTYPWYVHSLMADRVWKEFGITGKGTLNIIQDNNFFFPGNLVRNVYRNPDEVPGNGKDDDGNGLVDDTVGFDFARNTAHIRTVTGNANTPQALHGTMCAAIICGTGTDDSEYQFGIAPEGTWAGLIANAHLESAVEWAVLQGADTYSMSFSVPNLGEMRSHWRKIMEHGSLCGVYFVSGAGNFAQTEKVPVQMRVPEDIPEVVFAAAGVQRDFSQTPFSSMGPVEWKTEHYQDGLVQKPEVCAFNHGLPVLLPDGTARPNGLNGNSFAGPMFCGSIALMLSADPDLLPWDLKEIITSTATDVGPEGVDYQTGHGLINCYRAVKEVLRRKAVREGKDPAPYTSQSNGDVIDPEAIRKALGNKQLTFGLVQRGGAAHKGGIRQGDHLVSVNGEEITSTAELVKAVRAAGREASKFVIKRDGKELELEVPAGPAGIGRLSEVYEADVFQKME